MNRIFTKKVLPLVLAAGLVLGLGGCSQRVPEQGDVPDSIDELSEGMPSDKEEEPQQLEPPQEQSLQQSNEEKNPLEDQLAGEKPEDKPEELRRSAAGWILPSWDGDRAVRPMKRTARAVRLPIRKSMESTMPTLSPRTR